MRALSLSPLLLLGIAVLFAGCTLVRYGLAPTKDDSLAAAFASEQAAAAFFAPFRDVTIDVFVGLSHDAFMATGEQAVATGQPVPIDAERVGSGTVVEGGRLVLTAAHVVAGGGPIVLSARSAGERAVTPAAVVWCSRAIDLAALRPETPYARGLEWARAPEVGESVYLVGLMGRHAAGEIVGIEPLGTEGWSIRHSAPIRGGDSGGPLVTADGELVGINARIEFGAIRYAYSEARRPAETPRGNDCT